jgi:hypothetical protein
VVVVVHQPLEQMLLSVKVALAVQEHHQALREALQHAQVAVVVLTVEAKAQAVQVVAALVASQVLHQ